MVVGRPRQPEWNYLAILAKLKAWKRQEFSLWFLWKWSLVEERSPALHWSQLVAEFLELAD